MLQCDIRWVHPQRSSPRPHHSATISLWGALIRCDVPELSKSIRRLHVFSLLIHEVEWIRAWSSNGHKLFHNFQFTKHPRGVDAGRGDACIYVAYWTRIVRTQTVVIFLPGLVALFICLTICSSATKADSLGVKEHKPEVVLKQGSLECI